MKKKITLVMMALLAVMGAKADVIPSSYYSTVGEGTFYIYDVTSQKFVGRETNRIAFENTPTKTFTLTSGENGGYTIRYDATTTYVIWNPAGQGQSWGSDFWMDANGVKDDGSGQYCSWNFTDFNTKTYKISTNYSYGGSTERTGGTAKYLQGTVWSTDDAASAHEYALITVANYNAYVEVKTYNDLAATASIPATYFTTTPEAGTYYLYSPYASCFLYPTSDRAGLQNTPETITLTANGDDYNIQFSNGKYLKYDAVKQGNTWANGTTGEAWSFTSFHGATGLFFVKHVSANSFLYAKETQAANWGGECWGTAETGNTRYAWALISATDYEDWQNSFVLSDANTVGYSATRDIYNVNPTVNRAMTANVWNTLVVPFDMAIPSGWTVVEPTSFSDGTLSFGTASSIEAGKPYLVKPTSAVTSFTATDVTLKKDLNPTAVGTGTTVTMSGTYTKIDAVPEGSYVLHTDNKLYKVNSTVSLKPFRAYFTVSDPAAVKANVISLNFDGETTGVNSLSPDPSPVSEGSIYNLAGQRMSKLQRGVNIVNGKKVSVK